MKPFLALGALLLLLGCTTAVAEDPPSAPPRRAGVTVGVTGSIDALGAWVR